MFLPIISLSILPRLQG